MTQASSAAPDNWAAELRDMVNRSFDPNELHELTFDFNIDYDSIPGDGKARKVVELLQILARQQRVPEFIERCQILRPRENWQPLLEAAQQSPLVTPITMDTLGQTAVSPTSTPPSFLQNKWLLIGGVVVLLAVVLAVVLLNNNGNTVDYSRINAELNTLLQSPQVQSSLIFDELSSGWLLTGEQTVVITNDSVTLGPQTGYLRDKTFVSGQGILLDFTTQGLNDNDPVVTFSLQNGTNAEAVTRVISLQALTRPESVGLDGETPLTPRNFDRNFVMRGDEELYALMMGLDENGRFIASVWDPNLTEEKTTFIYNVPREWANETWRFNVQTGDSGSITLISGWEFTFDQVR